MKNDFGKMEYEYNYSPLAEVIRRTPSITGKEAADCVAVYRAGGHGAGEAEEKLVTYGMKIALNLAIKYCCPSVPLDDLLQEAFIGIRKGIEKYDPEMGKALYSYLYLWVKQALTRCFLSYSKQIQIPTGKNEKLYKVKKSERLLFWKNGYEPSASEIAKESGLPEETVLDLLATEYVINSMDSFVSEDEDTSFAEFFADENAENPYEHAEKTELSKDIDSALDMLGQKEQKIIRLRFGIGGNSMSLAEIGDLPEFKVSKARISQMEKSALKKLRQNPKVVSLLKDYYCA